VLLSLGVAAAPAYGDAPTDGCPAGFSLESVSDLVAAGYTGVAPKVDDPNSGLLSYGRPGNGDGFICARQLGNQVTSFGGALYEFIDDTLPAS
jgi:hypothetical protein